MIPALGHVYAHRSIKEEELCEVCFPVFCQEQLQTQSPALHSAYTVPGLTQCQDNGSLSTPSLVPRVPTKSMGLALLSSAKLFCAGLPCRAEVLSLLVRSSVHIGVSQSASSPVSALILLNIWGYEVLIT